MTYVRPVLQYLTTTNDSLLNWYSTSLFDQNCSFEACVLSRIWSHCSTHTHHHTSSIWRWRMLPPLPWKLLLLWLPGATFPTNSWKNPRSPKLTKSQTVLLHFIIDPSSLPFSQICLFPLLILSLNESNVLSSLILEICHCYFFYLFIFIFSNH